MMGSELELSSEYFIAIFHPEKNDRNGIDFWPYLDEINTCQDPDLGIVVDKNDIKRIARKLIRRDVNSAKLGNHFKTAVAQERIELAKILKDHGIGLISFSTDRDWLDNFQPYGKYVLQEGPSETAPLICGRDPHFIYFKSNIDPTKSVVISADRYDRRLKVISDYLNVSQKDIIQIKHPSTIPYLLDNTKGVNLTMLTDYTDFGFDFIIDKNGQTNVLIWDQVYRQSINKGHEREFCCMIDSLEEQKISWQFVQSTQLPYNPTGSIDFKEFLIVPFCVNAQGIDAIKNITNKTIIQTPFMPACYEAGFGSLPCNISIVGLQQIHFLSCEPYPSLDLETKNLSDESAVNLRTKFHNYAESSLFSKMLNELYRKRVSS